MAVSVGDRVTMPGYRFRFSGEVVEILNEYTCMVKMDGWPHTEPIQWETSRLEITNQELGSAADEARGEQR
jgi:hypothetical protein